jgi:hypothetical protein
MIRRQVLALEGVQCLDERDAVGVHGERRSGRITSTSGQAPQRRNAGTEKDLLRDLIVDAASRGSGSTGINSGKLELQRDRRVD